MDELDKLVEGDPAEGVNRFVPTNKNLLYPQISRYDTGDPHNDIYALLNGERLDQRPFYVKRECTGTLICGARKGAMSNNDALAFKP